MPIKLPFPELLFPYSPVAKPMPVPPIQNVCEGGLVCVSFSCSLIPYLLGLLEVYRYRDSFKGTEEEKTIAVGVMRQLMEVLAMSGCGCDDDVVKLTRINPDNGTVETSDNGGVTWTPDPKSPYVQAVQVPPLKGADGDSKRCSAANNVIDELKRLTAVYAGYIGVLETIFEFEKQIILEALQMLFIALDAEALAAEALPIVSKAFDQAQALVHLTVEEWDAMFTTEGWTTAQCILFCEGHASGIYNQGDWARIRQRFLGELGSGTYTMGASLAATLDQWTLIGLNNCAATGADISDNCGDCDCGCGSETIGTTLDLFYGLIVSRTACNVQSTSQADGSLWSTTWQWDTVHPFKLTAEGLTAGNTGVSTWQWYLQDGSGPFFGLSAPLGVGLQFLELSGNAGEFTISWDVATPT